MKLNETIKTLLALSMGLYTFSQYSRSSMLNLPLISLIEDNKVANCWQHMTSDKNICNHEIKTNTDRKWKAEVTIGREIVAEKKNWELIGAVQSHQHCTGF